jgi:ankyrin repeat protein
MKAFIRSIKQNDFDEVCRLRYTVSINDTYKWYSPLIFAISKIEIFQYLLEHGADPNWKDHNQCSILHHAVWGNCIETTLLLLNAGANINLQDCQGDTVLHYAMIHGTETLIQLLIDCGADTNILNNKQLNPMDRVHNEIDKITKTLFPVYVTIEQLTSNSVLLDEHLIQTIKEPMDEY